MDVIFRSPNYPALQVVAGGVAYKFTGGTLLGRRGVSVILAIDPGPEQSAWLVLGHTSPRAFRVESNERLLEALREGEYTNELEAVVIEKIASYGMSVGAEVFETVWWSGRFAEAAHPLRAERLTRLAVKMHLCHDSRAKDANIRQALIDRFGGSAAIGRKASPGPLYGIAGDVWSALAVAVCWADGVR